MYLINLAKSYNVHGFYVLILVSNTNMAETYTFIVILLVNDILAYLLTHLKIERIKVRLQGGKSFIYYLSLAFLRTVGG